MDAEIEHLKVSRRLLEQFFSEHGCSGNVKEYGVDTENLRILVYVFDDCIRTSWPNKVCGFAVQYIES